MSENQQNINSVNNKKSSNILVFVLLFSTLIFAAIAFWVYNNSKDFEAKKEIAEKNLKQLEEKIGILSEILKIDELVMLEGQYVKGLENFQDILEKSEDEYIELVQIRINSISQLLSENENSSKKDIEKNLIISQQIKQIENYKILIDSLKRGSYSSIDSLKNKISVLNETIDKKEKQLNRKEKIKVLSFNNLKGGKIHYLGEVENEKANGGGIGIWTTGSIYKGEWKNNLRHGKGTFEWADGEKYEGEYVNDIRNGKGTYIWPSGERYVGAWKNDKRNGFGTLYDRDSNIRFEGEWIDDKPQKD